MSEGGRQKASILYRLSVKSLPVCGRPLGSSTWPKVHWQKSGGSFSFWPTEEDYNTTGADPLINDSNFTLGTTGG